MAPSTQDGLTSPLLEYEDFFRYTSGRWLWDEEQQLAIGTNASMSREGITKSSRLVMNDGKTVIARIPNPNTGPPFYATASEVATMELVRTVLRIPVPEVYEWCASADNNPIGAEYIIMEEAQGVQPANVWNVLTADSKLAIMREVVSIETKLLSLSFSHYGNIYFAQDAVQNSVPAEIIRSTPLDYATSIARREIAWIKNYAVLKAPDDPLLVSAAQNSPDAHIRLLEDFLKAAPYLLDIDRRLTRPTLWQTDLHSSNLFVHGDRITSVIDWQGVWAGPLFLQAQPPQLVDYQGEMLLKRPDNFDDLDDRKTQIRQQIARSTLFQLYLLQIRKQNPLLAAVFHLDHGKTRRLPVEFAGNTWDDDIVSFREVLINECPIHFSEEDLKNHLRDSEGWNEVQDFLESIDGLVKRDGWTHNETFDEARSFFSRLREVGLSEMKGRGRERFERETRWVERS
ncbi:kinase-like domain-containing protein [Thermoascus aurantiacus ATCC 26904]